MQWIATLLDRIGLSEKPLGFPCLVLLKKENVRMELLEIPLPCGHSGYCVDLSYYLEEMDEWVPIASLRDFTLPQAIELLHRAQQCIQNLEAI